MFGLGEMMLAEMKRFQDSMSKMAGDLSRIPAMNLEEKEDNVIVKVELPGITKEDIQLKVTENELEVKAGKEKKSVQKGSCCESYFEFQGMISLPSVQCDKVKAVCKDGILTVTIPKVKKKAVQEIKID